MNGIGESTLGMAHIFTRDSGSLFALTTFISDMLYRGQVGTDLQPTKAHLSVKKPVTAAEARWARLSPYLAFPRAPPLAKLYIGSAGQVVPFFTLRHVKPDDFSENC